jgi:hypothetical protein
MQAGLAVLRSGKRDQKFEKAAQTECGSLMEVFIDGTLFTLRKVWNRQQAYHSLTSF